MSVSFTDEGEEAMAKKDMRWIKVNWAMYIIRARESVLKRALQSITWIIRGSVALK